MTQHINQFRKMHFIGIGGIGMSALAEFLHRRGFVITGSDSTPNLQTDYLIALGISIFSTHEACHVADDVDAVVYSSAISSENPEWIAACSRDLPLFSRGWLLAEVARIANSTAVAGAHGKTTTTALIAHLLKDLGRDPTYFIGGILSDALSPVHCGSGDDFVAEVDESDASFLYLEPKSAVVTNIDADHLQAYGGNLSTLTDAFFQFLSSIPDGGTAVLNADDATLTEMIPRLSGQVLTFGFSEAAQVRAQDFRQEGIFSHFSVRFPGCSNLFKARFPLPGRYNVLNALAALALCFSKGISPERLLKSLESFPGVGRRFELMGAIPVEGGEVVVLNDYGHHPNELKFVIQTFRDVWPGRRLVMVFQPHRYTRTRDLFDAFVLALKSVDVLFLMDVYAASEPIIFGATSQDLARSISMLLPSQKPVCISDKAALLAAVKATLLPGDVLVFQGAGNVLSLGKQLMEKGENI